MNTRFTPRCTLRTTSATLSHLDTTPPLLTVPAQNLTVEADGFGNKVQLTKWLLSHGGATAVDTNSKVNWRYSPTVPQFETVEVEGTVVFSQAVFTFDAFDNCDNHLAKTTAAFFNIVDTVKPQFLALPSGLTVLEADGNGNPNEYALWIETISGAAVMDVGFAHGKCHSHPDRQRRQSNCFCNENLHDPVCVGGALEFVNACLAWCDSHYDFALGGCPSETTAIVSKTTATTAPPTSVVQCAACPVDTLLGFTVGEGGHRTETASNGFLGELRNNGSITTTALCAQACTHHAQLCLSFQWRRKDASNWVCSLFATRRSAFMATQRIAPLSRTESWQRGFWFYDRLACGECRAATTTLLVSGSTATATSTTNAPSTTTTTTSTTPTTTTTTTTTTKTTTTTITSTTTTPTVTTTKKTEALCVDHTPGGKTWTDIDGETCAAYTSKRYCANGAVDTQGWGTGTDSFADYSKNGFHAGHVCCECGGGTSGFAITAESTFKSPEPIWATTRVAASTHGMVCPDTFALMFSEFPQRRFKSPNQVGYCLWHGTHLATPCWRVGLLHCPVD